MSTPLETIQPYGQTLAVSRLRDLPLIRDTGAGGVVGRLSHADTATATTSASENAVRLRLRFGTVRSGR